MYSIVLMMALSGGGDTAQAGLFHNRCSGGEGGYAACSGGYGYGCSGGYGYGCSGGYAQSGCCGGGHHGHRLFGHHRGHGCHGGYASCSGGYGYGCSGGYGYGCSGGSGYGCTGGYGYGGMGGYGCMGGYGGMGGYGCTGGYAIPAGPATLMPTGPGGKPPEGTGTQPRRETIPAPGTPNKEEASLPAPATIIVSLPAEAKLSVDGVPTRATSTTRVFATPNLDRDNEYFYTLTAEIARNGKTLTATKKIAVRAGQETRVSLEFASAETLAQR